MRCDSSARNTPEFQHLRSIGSPVSQSGQSKKDDVLIIFPKKSLEFFAFYVILFYS